MSTITEIIMDDTLTAADWDYDPKTGSSSALTDVIDAPEGYDSGFFTFDPYC